LGSEKDQLLQKSHDEVSRLQDELKQQIAAASAQQQDWKQQLEVAESEAQKSVSVAVAEVTQTLTLQLEKQLQSHQQVLAERGDASEQSMQQATQDASALHAQQQQAAAVLQATVTSLESDLAECRVSVVSKEKQLLLAGEDHAAALLRQEVDLRGVGEKQAAAQVRYGTVRCVGREGGV
jgi:hypothetical protein